MFSSLPELEVEQVDLVADASWPVDVFDVDAHCFRVAARRVVLARKH